jgi:hypothetical protein
MHKEDQQERISFRDQWVGIGTPRPSLICGTMKSMIVTGRVAKLVKVELLLATSPL